MVVIFLLAVGTVAVGGYWAGVTEADRLQRRRARGGGGARRSPPRGALRPGGAQRRRRGVASGLHAGHDVARWSPCPAPSCCCSISSTTASLYAAMIAIFGLGARAPASTAACCPWCATCPGGGTSGSCPAASPPAAAPAAGWPVPGGDGPRVATERGPLGVAAAGHAGAWPTAFFVPRRMRLPTLKSCAPSCWPWASLSTSLRLRHAVAHQDREVEHHGWSGLGPSRFLEP